jgi:hypothetical protein
MTKLLDCMTPLLVFIYRLLMSVEVVFYFFRKVDCFVTPSVFITKLRGWHKFGGDVGDVQGLRHQCFQHNSQERPCTFLNELWPTKPSKHFSLIFIGNSSVLCVFCFQVTKAELPEEANNAFREQFLENCASRICLDQGCESRRQTISSISRPRFLEL